jgi:hypothetical protein
MIKFIPAIVGILAVVAAMRAVKLGGASADGKGFRRDEVPLVFWAIVILEIGIACTLFWRAAHMMES